MTSIEEQLRMQLFEAEGKLKDSLQRIEEVKRIIEPFLAMAQAVAHLPDEEIIAGRPVKKMSGYQMVNLEARNFKALADWVQEGEEGQ